MALGVTRIGATATATIIDDFRARKAGSDAGRDRGGRRLLMRRVGVVMLGSGTIGEFRWPAETPDHALMAVAT